MSPAPPAALREKGIEMLPKTELSKSAARAALACALLASLCLAAAAQQQPPIPQQPPVAMPPSQQPTPRPPVISQPPVTPEQRRKRDILLDTTRPTMKEPEGVAVPRSRERRSYDEKRDATYVNVDVTLLAHRDVREPKGVIRFEGREVTLTFQLAYRGRQTYDLISAYLIVESTAAPAEADKLAAVRQLQINADPYEYAYERFDYQTELVAPVKAGTSVVTVARQQLRKEIAAFKLPPEDLPQLVGAGRLIVKLGPESFTVKSPQLSELRRTLADGAAK